MKNHLYSFGTVRFAFHSLVNLFNRLSEKVDTYPPGDGSLVGFDDASLIDCG